MVTAMSTNARPEWTFGDRLRKSREDAGLAQAEMAGRFDVSEATISNWETQARKPRSGELDLAHKWEEETRGPVEWLLGLVPDVYR